MYSISALIKRPPFLGRLTVSVNPDYKSIVGDAKKILIVASDADYLFLGARVKKVLEEQGYFVQPLSLDGFDGLRVIAEDFEDFDCVIAVGERPVCDGVRACFFAKKMVFVPTSLVFYYAFSPLIVAGETSLDRSNAPLPASVVLDLSIIEKLKVRHIADAFCSVATSVFWQLELKMGDDFADGDRKMCLDALDQAVKAMNAVGQKPYETLIRCQLLMSLAVSVYPAVDYLTDRTALDVLEKLVELPSSEARFMLARVLTDYCFVTVSLDLFDNVIAPDYLKAVFIYCDIYQTDADKVIERFCFHSAKECEHFLKTVRTKENVEFCSRAEKTMNGLSSAYKTIYKGKQKRAAATREQLSQAITLGSALSKGYLKYLFDYGVTGLLLDIKR